MKSKKITSFLKFRLVRLTALTALFSCFVFSTYGTAITWSGSGSDQKWSNTANWTGSVLPGTADVATIPAGFTVIVDVTPVSAVNKLFVYGTLTVNSGAILTVNQTTSSGTSVLEIGGGTVNNNGTINITNALSAGSNSGLSFVNSSTSIPGDGTFTNAGTLSITTSAGTGACVNFNQTTGGIASFNMGNSGVTLTPAATKAIFNHNAGNAQIGGTLNIGNSTPTYLSPKLINVTAGNLTLLPTATINAYLTVTTSNISIGAATGVTSSLTNNGVLNLHLGGTATNNLFSLSPLGTGATTSVTFTNAGTINIDGAYTSGSYGVFACQGADALAQMTINNTGTISDTHSGAPSIYSFSATSAIRLHTFNNYGTMSLSTSTTLGCAATLNNYSGGYVYMRSSLSGSAAGTPAGAPGSIVNNYAGGVFNFDATTITSTVTNTVSFRNYGTVIGRGAFLTGTYVPESGGIIAPGNTNNTTGTAGTNAGTMVPYGQFTINGSPLDFSNNTFVIKVNGTTAGTNFDQVTNSTASAAITLTGANFILTKQASYTAAVSAFNATNASATITGTATASGDNGFALTKSAGVVTATWTTGQSAIAPSIITPAPTTIAATSALFNGNLTNDGGASIIARGFCYKTATGVAITDNQTAEGGTAVGTYSRSFSSLLPNTQYFYKGYATNSVGTTLSATELSFYTLANVPAAPTVATASSTTINVTINENNNSATTTFAIMANGQYVQADGSLNTNPVWQTKAIWGSPKLVTVTTGISYVFKIKAKNGAGVETAFGTPTPAITTNAVTAIAATTATGNGNLVDLGNPAFTNYGICWKTSAGASISDYVTNITSPLAIGAFGTSLTGLTPNTTYYANAYATNSVGTTYGTEVSFLTLAAAPAAPTVGGITATSVNIAINENGNPATTTFAIKENNSGFYVQDDGTVTVTTNVWHTKADWGTKTVTGLTANTSYTFLAKAQNSASATVFGATTIVATLPLAPTSTAASAITSAGFTANWTAPTQGAVTFTYTLEYGTISDLSSGTTVVSGIASTNLSNAITGLLPGTTYYYHILSSNASGVSSYSTIQSVTTNHVTPTVGTYSYNGNPQGPTAATNNGTGTSYTFSYASQDGTTYPASSTLPTAAGSYYVTATVDANGNYASASSVATAFTIVQAPITITANNANKTYGSSLSSPISGSSSFTITSGSLKNGETISSFTKTFGAGAIAATDAVGSTSTITMSAPVGANNFSTSNYNISYVAGTLTVTAAPLTITGLSGVNKIFDSSTTASLSGTPAYSGLVNNEVFSVTGTPIANFADATIGIGKAITVTGYTPPSTNYSLTQPTGLTADIVSSTQNFTSNKTETAIVGTTADITLSGVGTTLSIGGNKTVNSMTVNAGSKLDFTGANTLSITGDLLLKADLSNSFSANIGSGTLAVTGAIKYLRTIDASKWYFIAFPSDVTIAQITADQTLGTLGTDWFIKYYDGAKRGTYGTGSNWTSITAADVTATPSLKLNKYQGYIFGLANGKPTTELSFPLDKTVVSTEPSARSIAIAENAGAASVTNHGWNLIGQPYLSNYVECNTTGTFNIYVSDGVSTYTPYTQATLPTLNPMSAYFIQASTALAGTGITFNTAGRQSIRSVVATDYSADKVQLNFTSSTGTDYTLLTMDNNLTSAYEIGYDLEKWIGTGTDKPQVYTQLNGINYAFNALPMNDVSNLPVGFYTKTAGTTTISANAAQASGLSRLLLTDNSTSPVTVTDLLTSDYSFNASAGTDNARFVLTAQRITTENIIETDTGGPTLFINNSKLIINKLDTKATVRVIDAIGRMLTFKVNNNSSLEISLPMVGMYSVQIESGSKSWIRKIVNR